MRARCTFKRFTAFILSLLMVLACLPMSAMAEETAIPEENISIEVIPNEMDALSVQEPEEVAEDDASIPMDSADSAGDEPEMTEKTLEQEVSEEADPDSALEDEPFPIEPDNDSSDGTEAEASEPALDDWHPLQAAIAAYGHVYVATVRKADVFSSPTLDTNTLIFSTSNDIFLFLATKFTEHETVMVWFLDEEGNVVSGYVSVKDLDVKYLLDEDIKEINFLPVDQGMTAIGMMSLFLVNDTYPAETAENLFADNPVEEEPVVSQDELTEVETVQEMEPAESKIPDETGPTDEPLEIPADEPTAELEQEETPEALPVETEEPQEETPEALEEPAHDTAGSYVNVTTQTRVFASMDSEAGETYYSSEYLGNFVKDATVQILSVDFDENGSVWYQVRFLYGDDFADGRLKWTDYATAWILPDETMESSGDSCTVTDFAYTVEYLNMTRSSGR